MSKNLAELKEVQDEYREIAERLWTANKASAEAVAKIAFSRHSIPPAVASLPGMPAFLADLQKLSFMQGVASLMYALDHRDAAKVGTRKPC